MIGRTPDDFEHVDVEEPEDLIDWVLRAATEALGLETWDAGLVEEFLDACEGSPHFDQFMALPEASLPGTA